MRARWRVTLDGAKDEALLAVDLYNQPRQARRLEGFVVHMHLAWLYLFQARYQRDKLPFHYRRPNGRYERVDGEIKTWDLTRFVRERWADNDPVRKNLEFTIALRHKIEHRYAAAMALATAGKAQALLVNFEEELTSTFGSDHTLGQDLRFPVFIGALTRQGAARLVAAQKRLPKHTQRFLDEFDAGLDPSIVQDQRYEFRVHLVPKTGPKTDADLALTFLRESDLDESQRKLVEQLGTTGTVIVREQTRDVASADKMRPGEASKRIESRIAFKFSVYSHFRRAWQALGVRPPSNDPHPERTKAQYCVYDKPHRDYLYTEAFVDRVVNECSNEEGFRRLLDVDPVRKVTTLLVDRAS